jgi:hypothetical protein
MVEIRYWTNRVALVGTFVLASAVAGGWKWNRLGL